jgi:hypothetical protein
MFDVSNFTYKCGIVWDDVRLVESDSCLCMDVGGACGNTPSPPERLSTAHSGTPGNDTGSGEDDAGGGMWRTNI